MLGPRKVWVWKEIPETVAIEKHGYLRAGDDDIRGERISNPTIVWLRFIVF